MILGLKSWVLAGGVGLAVLIGSNVWSYNKGLNHGYANAVAEVNRANNAAQNAAQTARDELRARCQRDPSGCLSDGWTRDSGDRVPNIPAPNQQR